MSLDFIFRDIGKLYSCTGLLRAIEVKDLKFSVYLPILNYSMLNCGTLAVIELQKYECENG